MRHTNDGFRESKDTTCIVRITSRSHHYNELILTGGKRVHLESSACDHSFTSTLEYTWAPVMIIFHDHFDTQSSS